MNIRRLAAGSTLAILGLMAPGLSQAQTAGQTPPTPAPASRVPSDNRLFIRFIEDAAIVSSFRAEAQFWYFSHTPSLQSSFDLEDLPGSAPSSAERDADRAGDANVYELRPLFAFNVAEDFEFGARIGFAERDPSRGGGDTGLTDLEVWGKISVVSEPVKISTGMVVSVPTGDEDNLLGTGETNLEFFGAIRKDWSHLSLAGNLGVRINQDQDLGNNEAEGTESILVGAAVLVPVGAKLVLTAEWAFETERLEGLKNYSTLLGGGEYRLGESLMCRAAVGGGLSDGAPDFVATASLAWLF